MRFYLSVIITGLFIVLYNIGFFSIIDNKIYDSHFQKGRNAIKDSQIVILSIDDYSIEKYKIWPWPRQKYIDIVDLLVKEDAKVIAFDINFDSYTGYNNSDDIKLGQKFREAGNVVLAKEMRIRKKKIFFTIPVPEIASRVSSGLVNVPQDADSVVRRYSVIHKVKNEELDSFVLKILEKYYNLSSHELKKIIPYDSNGLINIHYRGGSGSFPTIPIAIIFENNFLRNNPLIFKNKIVLIGSTAEYLQDLFVSPTEINMPGVEINASALYTVINKEYIKPIPLSFYYLYIFLMILLIVYGTYILGAALSLVGLAVLSIINYELSGVFFSLSINFPVAAAGLGLLFGYFVCIFIKFINENKEKLEIKQIFKQYISPVIVSDLLAGKAKINLGGERKEVTILFSDIVDFTSFCEQYSAEEVVAQLNEYFDVMTEVIAEYQGTLDKYVGDEIMAIWGAPLEQTNHALLCVKSAMKQIDVLHNLQIKWKAEGKKVLEIGIGINTGEVVVGNIGAERFKNYTVIGDAVNTAFRLQSYTRVVSMDRNKKCSIIVSEKTKSLIDNYVEVELIGDIKMKGKNQTVRVWEVIGWKKI